MLWGAWQNGQPPGPEVLNAGPFQPYGPVFPNYGPPRYSSFDAPMIDPGFHAQSAPQYAPAAPSTRSRRRSMARRSISRPIRGRCPAASAIGPQRKNANKIRFRIRIKMKMKMKMKIRKRSSP